MTSAMLCNEVTEVVERPEAGSADLAVKVEGEGDKGSGAVAALSC